MLEIIITHYKEPWEICRAQFMMLDMQRRVDWSEIRVTVINDGGYRLPEEELNALRFGHEAIELRQIDIPHGGISAARNAGIDNAEEPWIMFCDCDDCFANIYALEDIMNVIRGEAANKYDLMWTHMYEEDSVSGRILLVPAHKTFVFCHGKIYRRKYLLDQGMRFEEGLRMNEDSCFNAVMIARGCRVGQVWSHVPLYTWIRRRGSVTTGPDAQDEGARCQTRRNMIVTEENRIHRNAQYPAMVTRTAYDAYFMIHGDRISESCKHEILNMIAPWLSDRMDVFGQVDEDTLDKIRGISRMELLDREDDAEGTHEEVRAWVDMITEAIG